MWLQHKIMGPLSPFDSTRLCNDNVSNIQVYDTTVE